jgi:hypothetical protein
LISIDIPDGITEISNKAFYYCQSLTTIDIPDDVTAIGECAFYGCTSLTTIDIPDDVNSIGNSAFYNCSSLASINIPNSVTSIGSSAFYNCASLKSVHITDLSAWCKITFSNYNSNPLNRGIKLYLNNNELTELVVPADIKKIKDQAFYNCKSITKVTIGEQVISIGILSFRGCTSLAQVYCQGTIPPTINLSSGNSSFSESGSSRTLYVPKGCSSAYQSSGWASFFGSIQEME